MDGSWLYRGPGTEKLVTVKEGKMWSQGKDVAAITHKSRMIKKIDFDFFNRTSSVVGYLKKEDLPGY